VRYPHREFRRGSGMIVRDFEDTLLQSRPHRIFALPEYGRAQMNFIGEGIRRLMEANDEVWARLRRAEPREAVPISQNTMPSGQVVQNEPLQIASKLAFTFEEIRSCDLDAISVQLDNAAEQSLSVVMPHFFAMLERTSRAAGTAWDAGGRPFSHEMFLADLERLDLEFDDRGNPQMPTIVTGPDVARQILAMPAPTSAQLKAFQDLIERKREAFNARRRDRKLR
jgi:hypothetical protein